MKIVLVTCVLLFVVSTFAQSNTFSYVSQKKYNKAGYDLYSIEDISKEGCPEDPERNTALYIEILTFNPELTDGEKEDRLIELDKTIAELQKIELCPGFNTVIIRVGEAAFLRSSDNYILYSKKYYNSYCPLNAKRFWARYKDEFSKFFPGKSIIYTDWEW